MNWKSTAIVSGAGLLATWLGWNSQPAPHVASAPARVAVRAPRPNTPDIQQQAAKLQSRVRGISEFREPARNPFKFGARPLRSATSVTPAAPRAALAPSAPLPAPPPSLQFSLSGIASDAVDGATTRTAIFSTPTGVVLAKIGDSLGSGYRVGKIEESAVDIIDADGGVRTLTLRP
jgi:hypothetical protein